MDSLSSIKGMVSGKASLAIISMLIADIEEFKLLITEKYCPSKSEWKITHRLTVASVIITFILWLMQVIFRNCLPCCACAEDDALDILDEECEDLKKQKGEDDMKEFKLGKRKQIRNEKYWYDRIFNIGLVIVLIINAVTLAFSFKAENNDDKSMNTTTAFKEDFTTIITEIY